MSREGHSHPPMSLDVIRLSNNHLLRFVAFWLAMSKFSPILTVDGLTFGAQAVLCTAPLSFCCSLGRDIFGWAISLRFSSLGVWQLYWCTWLV